MDRQRVLQVVAGLAVVAVLVAIAFQTCVVAWPFGTDRQAATVTVSTPDGEVLATVETEVADTHCQRVAGLSGTESLAAGSGMLFVHDGERQLTYVMRGMNYGLDIVFVGADGEITAIRSAPPPGPGEDGAAIQRSGRGKFVLEVPRGYTTERGIEVGDQLAIEYDS